MRKSWSTCTKNKYGPHLAVSNQPYAGPNVDRLPQTVTARWNEQNPLIGFLLDRVNGLLQSFGIVCNSVALYRKIVSCEVDRTRIFQAGGVVRGGEHWNDAHQHRSGKNFPHYRQFSIGAGRASSFRLCRLLFQLGIFVLVDALVAMQIMINRLQLVLHFFIFLVLIEFVLRILRVSGQPIHRA